MPLGHLKYGREKLANNIKLRKTLTEIRVEMKNIKLSLFACNRATEKKTNLF